LRAVVIAISVALTGCYSPSIAPCELACASGSVCPDGLACNRQNICALPGAMCSDTLTERYDPNVPDLNFFKVPGVKHITISSSAPPTTP